MFVQQSIRYSIVQLVDQTIHRLVNGPTRHALSPVLPSNGRIHRTLGDANEPARVDVLERIHEAIATGVVFARVENGAHRAADREIVRVPIYE